MGADGGRRTGEPQTPTQVGEQQGPQGALICFIGHFWGLGSLAGREWVSCYPHQGWTSCCTQTFFLESRNLRELWRRESLL